MIYVYPSIEQNTHVLFWNKQASQDTPQATTMMICNIPCRLGKEDVVNAIASVGFGDAYDFVYLPDRKRSTAKNRNIGYAFVAWGSKLGITTSGAFLSFSDLKHYQ